MASQIIGRTKCPECGFESAHVKKSDKCTYRYCPECQSQHHARTPRQVAELMAKTRPVEPTATGTATPTVPMPTPIEPTPTGSGATAPGPAPAQPTQHPPRKRLFG